MLGKRRKTSNKSNPQRNRIILGNQRRTQTRGTRTKIKEITLSPQPVLGRYTTDHQNSRAHFLLQPQQPPRKFVGIFWDIENCPLPSGRNPAEVIKQIRRYVAEQSPGFRESKFVAVLKITRYDKNSLLSLEHAGVKLVHVASDKPEAADLLLHKELDEFKDAHPAPGMP